MIIQVYKKKPIQILRENSEGLLSIQKFHLQLKINTSPVILKLSLLSHTTEEIVIN